MTRIAILLLLPILLFTTSSLAQSPAPTPVRPTPKPAYVPSDAPPPPVVRALPGAAGAPSWQRFQGATRCEQVGRTLSCDNGYRQQTGR